MKNSSEIHFEGEYLLVDSLPPPKVCINILKKGKSGFSTCGTVNPHYKKSPLRSVFWSLVTSIHLSTCIYWGLFCWASEVEQTESEKGGRLLYLGGWSSSEFKAFPGHIIKLALNHQNNTRKERKDRIQTLSLFVYFYEFIFLVFITVVLVICHS